MDRSHESSPFLKAAILAAILTSTYTPDASAQSYCNSAGCMVTGIGGGGGGWGGGVGGGWGGSGGTEDDRGQPPGDPGVMCPILKTTKPANCPSQPAQPTETYYAEDRLPAGSAMRKLMSLSRQTQGFSPQAKLAMVNALNRQSVAIYYGGTDLATIQNIMVRDVLDACELNRTWTDRWRYIANSTTPMERECAATADALIAESDNRQGFWPWFIQWAANDGIALSDLMIPQTLIDALSPQNSVTKRYNIITEDSICYKWWQEVKFYDCR